jgi:hypothetical protein
MVDLYKYLLQLDNCRLIECRIAVLENIFNEGYIAGATILQLHDEQK